MIAQALDAYVRSHARIFADRTSTVGASDVGQCSRKVFYSKNEGDPDYGAPRNPDFVDGWGASMRGRIFEECFWVPALRERYGERLLYAGERQQTFVLGFLSATPDALLIGLEPDVLAPLGVSDIGSDRSLVIECKTIDPRAKLDGPRIEHTYQAQVQLGLLHALTDHRPEYALISYSDASFWDLVYEFPIRRDPEIFETAQRRRDPDRDRGRAVAARGLDRRRPRMRALSFQPRLRRRTCARATAADRATGSAIRRRDCRAGARGQAPGSRPRGRRRHVPRQSA